MERVRATGSWLVVFVLGLSFFASVPVGASAQQVMPSIRITKKICDNSSFPVFVESHCYEDDNASFEIWSPNLQLAKVVRSGNSFQPTLMHFAQGNMWRAVDANQPNAPVTVLSCQHFRPGANLMLGVAPSMNLRGLPRWDFIWDVAYTGDGLSYAPSLECVWFELPNMTQLPAVLSLQAFTSTTPYMWFTDAQHYGFSEFLRGESGENLETNMVMSNTYTGEVYSFAADDYGQVLVPEGQYLLQNTDTGYQATIRMDRGWTVLVELGIGGLWQ